jgi:hypothetical protein
MPALRLALALLLLNACVVQRPPPAAPPMVAPPRSDVPPAPGTTRVYVDVVDGPSEVYALARTAVAVRVDDQEVAASALVTEVLCVTPCSLDLRPGRQSLAFPVRGAPGRLELATLDVGARPLLYRRVLGHRDPGGAGMVLGILGVTFGGLSLVTGATLLPVGLGVDSDGMTLAGGITLAAGALLTTVGILAIRGDPIHEQPGVGAQAELANSAP